MATTRRRQKGTDNNQLNKAMGTGMVTATGIVPAAVKATVTAGGGGGGGEDDDTTTAATAGNDDGGNDHMDDGRGWGGWMKSTGKV